MFRTHARDCMLVMGSEPGPGAASETSDGIVYSYSVPAGGYAGNGNILSQSDSVMGDWNFGYDNLSRLTSGTAANGTYAGQWGCWGYDSYGNRTMQVVGTQPCSAATPTIQYNFKNQISSAPAGFSYDPLGSGNMTYDGLNKYVYD